MSLTMMLVGSSLMGMSLYRDIEFSTKDYYLTYPISKAGYFWGRFFGSFLFVLLLGVGIPLGIFIGTELGQLTGRLDGGTGLVRALAFAPDGLTLASGDAGGIVRVWRASPVVTKARFTPGRGAGRASR